MLQAGGTRRAQPERPPLQPVRTCRSPSPTRRRRAWTTTDSPDPLLEGYGRAYGLAFAGYAADDLGFKTDLTYRLLDDEVNEKWEWREGGRHVLSTSSDLKKLLALNPAVARADRAWIFRCGVPVRRNPLAGDAPAGRAGPSDTYGLSWRPYVVHAPSFARRAGKLTWRRW